MSTGLYQRSNSAEDVEIAPLRSLTSSSQSKYATIGSPDEINHEDDSRSQPIIKQPYLLHEALAVLLFVLISWHGTRYLTRAETDISKKLPPFQLLADGQIILNQELDHPVVDPPTIPPDFLVFTSVGLPIAVLLISSWFNQRSVSSASASSARLHHLHASLCAFFTALALSEGPTQLLKQYVQRPRPNCYALCGFNLATQQCTADLSHIREAYLSFPSGHSSLSSCACVFLMWYLCGCCISSQRMSTLQKRLICWVVATSLLSWTIFVGTSRLHDHWHHPSDVLAGLILGSLAATLGYHAWYLPIWANNSNSAGLPYSLMMETSAADNGSERHKKGSAV
jgi:membrane-associated phospholipid phosphatase